MQEPVSTPGIGVWPLAAAVSLAWPAFILPGFPWTGFVWVSLACSAALWAVTSSSDLAVLPAREAMPAPKALF